MLKMDVEPRSFNFESVRCFKPMKENGSTQLRFTRLLRIIQVLSHPPAEIFG
jgi:hypothetical protein